MLYVNICYDKLKKVIREEFKHIKEIMDFDKKSHEIFKNWYVDGRILYHKVIDLKKPEEGLQDIRFIACRWLIVINIIYKSFIKKYYTKR